MTSWLAALLLGCTPEPTPEPPVPAAPPAQEARVGIAIPSYVHAVAWIAEENGHFEAANLDATVSVMGGSAATMRALISGAIDVGLAGGDAVIKANAAGADLVIVAGFVNRFYHRIVARQDTTDLRGKRIGLPFLGGPQDMAVRYALQQKGLTYGEDVEILSLGKEFNRMAALSRGEIDSTTSQTPPSHLAELGLSVVADLPAESVAFPYAMLVTTRQTLTEQPELVSGALTALCQGADDYRAQKDESLAIIGKHIQGSDTEAVAEERYRLAGPSMISSPPVPDATGLQMVIDFLGPEAVKGVTAAGVVDTGLLDAGACGAL